MKYAYSNHLYEIEINWILAIAGVITVLLNINTNTARGLKLLGIGIGAAGLVIAMIIKSVAKYRGDFAFVIHDKALKIHYMKKVVDFNWKDIDNISEDERGLIIKLNRNNIEFPILNDMDDYDNFKAQIIMKACEFRFPINVIKNEGRG